MTRRPLLCAVRCALALLVTALVLAGPGAAAQPVPAPQTAGQTAGQTVVETVEAGADPVTLNQVQPSALQVDQPVALSGVVRNTTDESWGEVQVSMVVSESPVSTADGLAQARGRRGSLALRGVLDPGDFQDLGDLPPGTETEFDLRNAWDDLPITRASGAYVIGVEVRAFVEDGLRSTVAESTAFIPLVGPTVESEPVELAMLWPLTAPVPRARNAYADHSLAAQFSAEGRLSRLTALGSDAGDFPLTWVVDPAVLDAAAGMSGGYQVSTGDQVAEDDARAAGAASWLSSTRDALSGQDVLTLPYGDPDVASLAHDDLEQALTPAAAAGSATLAELEVPEQSLLWPADGWLDRPTRTAAERLSPVLSLVAEDSVRGDENPPVVPLRVGETETTGVVYDRSAVSPRSGETTLQWRQQLLALSAVRALNGGGRMVVVPPRTLSPSDEWADTDFFAGLQAGWLRPTPLSQVTGDPAESAPRLRYPPRARAGELPADNLNAIASLLQTSRTLVGVLADPADTRQLLAEAAGISASMHWRRDPGYGLELTLSQIEANRTQLDQVLVEAPRFITLSGREGPFPVTVSNGLSDEAITVSVEVRSSNDSLQIEPLDQVTIEPQQRRSIPVQARYRGVGISNVTVRLLDRNGANFGEPVVLQVRTTQIGAVIWVVMAIGAAIILAAAARSVLRRVRGSERSEQTGDRAGGETPA